MAEEARDDERGSLTWQGNTLRYHVDENLQLRTHWGARDRSRWERDGWTVTPDSAQDDVREALANFLHQRRHPCGLDPVEPDYEFADAVLATLAPYRKHPEPEITGAQQGMTNAERHVLSTADAGTDHTRNPRQYVIACEWCEEVFYGPRFEDAISQFERHRDAMYAEHESEVAARRALRVPVGEGEQ